MEEHKLKKQVERAEHILNNICQRNGFIKTYGDLLYCEPLTDFQGRNDQLSNTITTFAINLNLGSTTSFQMKSFEDIDEVDGYLDNLIERFETQKRYLKNVKRLLNDFVDSELNKEDEKILEIIENMNYDSKETIKLFRQIIGIVKD